MKAALSPLLVLVFLFLSAQEARAQACDAGIEECWRRSGSGSGDGASPAYPTGSSGIHLNPSAVPTANGYGGELNYFNRQFDASVVHGTGRIGAALSLQNGEENFFGTPSFEIPAEYLERKQNFKEYHSQNFSLAGAVSLLDNHGHDLRHLQLSLGLQVQYNTVTKHILPGAGLGGIAGPFTFGVAFAQHQELQHQLQYGGGPDQEVRSNDITYSLGLYLNQLAIDYSFLQIDPASSNSNFINNSNVTLFTLTGFVQKFILTGSLRTERSDRSAYDFSTKTLFAQHSKQEIFGGLQYNVSRSVLVGCFYNYYLLREISLGLTIFI